MLFKLIHALHSLDKMAVIFRKAIHRTSWMHCGYSFRFEKDLAMYVLFKIATLYAVSFVELDTKLTNSTILSIRGVFLKGRHCI